MMLSLRKYGGVPACSPRGVFEETLDTGWGRRSVTSSERVAANEDGGVSPLDDLSVPENVTLRRERHGEP